MTKFNKAAAAALAGALCVFLSSRLGFTAEEATAAQTIITTLLVFFVPNREPAA